LARMMARKNGSRPKLLKELISWWTKIK
jgi:hypothetical protein